MLSEVREGRASGRGWVRWHREDWWERLSEVREWVCVCVCHTNSLQSHLWIPSVCRTLSMWLMWQTWRRWRTHTDTHSVPCPILLLSPPPPTVNAPHTAVSLKPLPMDELSVITEVRVSGHSTHTTYDSGSGGKEGGAAEEAVARKRWVESGVGKWLEQGHRSIVSHKVLLCSPWPWVLYRQGGRSWPEPSASGLRVLDEGDWHRQAVWGGTVGCCGDSA